MMDQWEACETEEWEACSCMEVACIEFLRREIQPKVTPEVYRQLLQHMADYAEEYEFQMNAD